MSAYTPGPYTFSALADVDTLEIIGADGETVAYVQSPFRPASEDYANAALFVAAPDLYDLATLTRDMRAAQKSYYARKCPPAEKRDLLIASRELEVALDRALTAVFAKIGSGQ